MKMRHSLFFALVAASAVALASSAVSAVAAETPFKGKITAVETSQLVFFPIVSVNREGTGTATYLGKYTEHATFQVNVLTMSSTGAATFTAANGDTLSASIVGQATRIGPTTLSIVEVYTITGGTGRLAGATGTFTLENTWSRQRALVLARSAEPSTTRSRKGTSSVLSMERAPQTPRGCVHGAVDRFLPEAARGPNVVSKAVTQVT
jgi:hypothetical protein